MIILTGGAGFIGSNLLRWLNAKDIVDVIVVDNLDHILKEQYLQNLFYKDRISIDNFWGWINNNRDIPIDAIIHLGACSDTTETNVKHLHNNNYLYSIKLWNIAIEKKIPFIYASSAATYGNRQKGFSDEHKIIRNLNPINLYGQYKHNFDLWALEQSEKPIKWIGLKYFNVYGPYEEHKGKMASVAYHSFNQVKQSKVINLFKSHKPDYRDGEQKRDFIFVDDVVRITLSFLYNDAPSGIYNVGTGQARTFNDLARYIFSSMNINGEINYIDIPKNIRSNYQYYTRAETVKLQRHLKDLHFHSLEEGVNKYIKFLSGNE